MAKGYRSQSIFNELSLVEDGAFRAAELYRTLKPRMRVS